MVENSSYLCSDKGLLLPLLDERNWAVWVRATLYLVGLLYSFLGIAIAADVFMCAIERITSKKQRVRVSDLEMDAVAVDGAAQNENADEEHSEAGDREFREVLIWNPTVANLTLMALGSSAPEILLSIIEICGNNFTAGDLGPGTIVGSAAFNLLGITAVCMYFLPEGTSKRIDQINVFYCTAAFSLFAYLWLLIVLMGFSPDVIEVWEGLFTLLFFVILVVVAWMIDVRLFGRIFSRLRFGKGAARTPLATTEKEAAAALGQGVQLRPGARITVVDQFPNDRYDEHRWKDVRKEVEREYPAATYDEIARIVAQRIKRTQPKNRLHYRIEATRWMSAMQRSDEKESMEATAHHGKPASRSVSAAQSTTEISYPPTLTREGTLTTHPGPGTATLPPTQKGLGIVEFAARIYGFSSSDPFVKIKITRRGRVHKRVMVRYETLNGSAKKNESFLPKAETIIFEPKETEKAIFIDLVKDYKWAEDSGFFVKLSLESADEKTKIGTCHPAIVRFNGDHGHSFLKESHNIEFQRRNYSCKESEGIVRLPVSRTGDVSKAVTLKYTTTDIEATEGKDYLSGPGILHFEPMELVKFLDIAIIDDEEEEKAETFLVTLTEPSDGAVIGARNNAVVTIISDENVKELVRHMHRLVPLFLKGLEPGTRGWKEQLMAASSVNGGDTAGATLGDLFTHLVAFPWKVLFSFVPPPAFCGGWLTFFVSLGLIGILTAIVGDLAGIFGCLVGLKDSVTAITLVAAGTSLPDLFASRLAAASDPNADNAIGNVTGSNSVNVFLGLGLPWLIAAIYHEANGTKFEVKAGDLGFSVVVYTLAAIICLVLLTLRRNLSIFGRAELGGPTLMKGLSAAFLGLLWFLYVLLSALQYSIGSMQSLYAHFIMLAATLNTVMYLIITAATSIKLSVPTEINRDANTIRLGHESTQIDNRPPSVAVSDDHSERANPAIVSGIELPKTMPLVVDPIWRPAGRFVIWKKTGQTLGYREACPAAFVMYRHMIVTAAHCITLQPARKDQVRLWEPNPDTSMYKCVFYQGQNGETVPQLDIDHPDSLRWDIDCSVLPKSFPNGPKAFYSDFLDKSNGKPLANSKSEQLDYAFIPVKKRDDQPANRHYYDLKFSKDHIGQEVLVFGYPKGNDNARKEARVTWGMLRQAADTGIVAIADNLIPETYKQPGFSGAPLVLKNGPDPNTGRYAIVGVYSWGNLLSPEFNQETKAFAENVFKSLKAKQD